MPDGYKHTYQSYVTFVEDSCPLSRDELALKLIEKGVSVRQGTQAVHVLGYYWKKYELKKQDFPMAWKADQQSMTIPLYPQMTDADKRIERWCQERGISIDSLSEDEMMQIVSEGIENVRKSKDKQ